MKLKIKKYYLDDLVEAYNKMFKDTIEYNDENGIFYFHCIGLMVKSWNNQIEILKNNSDITTKNLLYFISKNTNFTMWLEVSNEN